MVGRLGKTRGNSSVVRADPTYATLTIWMETSISVQPNNTHGILITQSSMENSLVIKSKARFCEVHRTNCMFHPRAGFTYRSFSKAARSNLTCCTALEIGEDRNPSIAYSVQKNSAATISVLAEKTHRYHYARFDGDRNDMILKAELTGSPTHDLRLDFLHAS